MKNLLKGKSICILTDYNDNEFDKLINIFNKHNINYNIINNYNEVCKNCNSVNKCVCIIFDLKNQNKGLSAAKNFCDGFASILYLRKPLFDVINSDGWKYISRFDSVLNSFNNWCIDGCYACENHINKCYENEVLQTICSAILIHKKRKDEYDKILNTFVNSYFNTSSYILLCVIDENGKIVSISPTFKNIFGENILGKKIEEISYEKISIDKLNINSIITLNNIDGVKEQIKLLNDYVLQNGVIYHLQIWERLSETSEYKNLLKKLDNIIEQYKHIFEVKHDH